MRSTPFHAIVRLVRQQLAQPGVTVTESKFLRDTVLGIEREVDIVVEGEFDGEPMVISIEVIERGRSATLSWVQEMIAKHRGLPTNRLLLVSKSGFTRNALAAVGREAGRVQALRPELIMVDGQPVVKRLFAIAINYAPTGCKLHVRPRSDEQIVVVGTPDTDVYGADGTLHWRTQCRKQSAWTEYGSTFPSRRTSTPTKNKSKHFRWVFQYLSSATTFSAQRPEICT